MQRSRRQKAIIRRNLFLVCSAAVLVLLVIGIIFGIKAAVKPSKEDKKNDSSVSSVKSEEKELKTVSSAYVVNTGDIMVHSTQLDGARLSADNYDFSDFFKYIGKYMKKGDLSVGNLEVTFGGTQSGAYSGYPAFNTPDSLADTIKSAGFNFLLTTNNHCYDTGLFGLKRTAQVVKEKGFSFIGTKETEKDPEYTVKKVNGIKLGITAFTYETKCDTAGRKSLNGNIVSADANELINSFSYERINEFYKEAQKIVKGMKNDGADKIIFYMHWGEEYQLKENTWQKSIAQELCNMGVDLIIGSHPHVVQPVALIHSESGEHTAVCAYSMGNAISNQRQELMHPECTTGHTEDGMILSYKFDKLSDGSVVLSEFDIVPTWVNKYKGKSGYIYSMIPLETQNSGSEFSLDSSALSRSQRSYERTKATVGAGLSEIQKMLGMKPRFE